MPQVLEKATKGAALDELKAFRLSRLNASEVVWTSEKTPIADAFEFQHAGALEMLRRGNALLADDMGLGKTLQAIACLAIIVWSRVLIVCPHAVKIHWTRELRRWLGDDFSIKIICGTRDKIDDAAVTVINYDIVKFYAADLRRVDWDALIIDEAHYLKNPKAQRTIAVFGSAPAANRLAVAPIQAKRVWALTGTPLENRPIELWPLIKRLDPAIFPRKDRFERRYCDARMTAFGWDVSGAKNLTELQTILRSTIMIRRTKAQVLPQLPPKRRQILPLQPAGAKLIKLLGQEREFFDTEGFKQSIKTLSYKSGFGDAHLATIRREIGLLKCDAVIAHLRECLEQSEKIICFCYHKAVAAALKDAFGDAAVKYVGDTSPKEKQIAVDRFMADKAVRVFIGNIDAAGTGITLTAASAVVFAEISWNPMKNVQAEDRAHRIGQTDSVLIQYIVWDGSVESYILHRVVEKLANVERAIDDTWLL